MSPTHELTLEHRRISTLLQVLERLCRAVEVDAPRLERAVDLLASYADRLHHGKEERHLFPALERAGLPRGHGPVQVMLDEHEEGRAGIDALRAGVRALRAGRPAKDLRSACARYVSLLREHIEKEDEVLFPMAEELLGASARAELTRAFAQVDAEVGDPAGLAARIDALAAEVLRVARA